MLEELIEAIKDGVQPSKDVIDGVTYSNQSLIAVRPPPQPKAFPIQVHTLEGVVEWCKLKAGKVEIREPWLHVFSPSSVMLMSGLFEEDHGRETYLKAEASAAFGNGFAFGQWYDCEEFLIRLLTLFQETEARSQLLALVGQIDEETVQRVSDDGISQQVIARVGIKRKQEVMMPNVVFLRPYRTFREIEQPESPFLLRMKGGREGGKPTCALFDVDGGAWKLEAIT